MPPAPRKKLIEVALPLKAINEAAAREKSIRHGHPSTLHLWWARRPLAACRAVLFASLVDDPDSDPDYQDAKGQPIEERSAAARTRLFRLIEELVQWENSNDRAVLHSARAEIARCVASRLVETGQLKRTDVIHGTTTVADIISKGVCRPVLRQNKKPKERDWSFDTKPLPPFDAVNAFLAAHAPPVLDPFCGGGSIPLEAQRLGLRAFASDLNPVPVLITKALIEIPPKFAGRPPVNPAWQSKSDAEKKLKLWEGAQGLADDVRYYGQWMRDEAEKRIGHLYPKVAVTKEMAKDRPDLKDYVGKELSVIAWLWARTVASPDPAAKGAHTPLVRSFALSTKKGKETWVRPIVNAKDYSFEFRVFTGKPPDDFDPSEGTVDRKGGRCILTGQPLPFPHIRGEGQAGNMKRRLMAIVAEGVKGRIYLSPMEVHVKVAESAKPTWQPDAELPNNPRDFKTPNYGMRTFADLFTSRQLAALTTFSDLVAEARDNVLEAAKRSNLPDDPRSLADGGTGLVAYGDSIATLLSFAVDKLADLGNSCCPWEPVAQCPRNLFGRQAIPMHWNYAEGNMLGESSGSWSMVIENQEKNLTSVLGGQQKCLGGNVSQIDATAERKMEGRTIMVSTDPPYYDNIGYADLSDFFYVWLRRSLQRIYPSLFSTALTPKKQELIATPYRHEGGREAAQAFFVEGFEKACRELNRCQTLEFPLTVYYAFKQSEDDADDDANANSGGTASTGWETMLEGLIRSSFTVIGTWPMRTELTAALKVGMNMLATSIVIVCRPRPVDAKITTRNQFLKELREALPKSLRDLQHGNIAPVDLAQAAIGPGMGVFTKFAKVVEPAGGAMTVRTALGLINQVLDETLAEQEGEFDPDTRWALSWFDQFGMKDGPFGEAETLSRAKGTAPNALEKAGIVKSKAGKVRLLSRSELPKDWDPATDNRLTVWETVQHLIRVLESDGEVAAAALAAKLGGQADVARDLAYRLYSICERKKWAEEARAYNGLVIAWPELMKLASKPAASAAADGALFDK